MAQPASILNTRSQSIDTMYAADGTPSAKLAVGNKIPAGQSEVFAWQGVATHVTDEANYASGDGVVVVGGVYSDDTPVPLLVDSAGRLLAVQVPTQGSLTDRSGTITAGTTHQELAAANGSRRYLMVQNLDGTEDLWINFGADAEIATAGSILIKAGVIFEMKDAFVSTQSVSVNATTTAHKFTAKEG